MRRSSVIKLFVLFALCTVISLYAEQIPIRGYVDADIGLNVRSGPSDSNSIITALTDRTELVIDSVSGNWYHITSPTSGYVYSEFVVVTEYGEAGEEAEANKIDESTLSPEEKEKIGCDIEVSLQRATITKTPNQSK